MAAVTHRLLVPVLIGSEVFGDAHALLLELAPPHLLVRLPAPLPLGAVVTVHFGDGGGEMVARATVRRLYAFNAGDGCDRLVGLTLLDFDQRPPLDLPTRSALH